MGRPLEKLRQVDMTEVAKVIKRPAKPDPLAIFIGKAVVLILSDPRYKHLLPAGTLDLQLAYLREVADTEALRKKALNSGYRQRMLEIEARTFPGLLTHFVLRKRKIEEMARRALNLGARQIVSLGAGFDTLLTRLAYEFPGVSCIEVDLQPTLAAKKKGLLSKPPNLHFVDLNLQEPFLEKVLVGHAAYRDREKTFFILEGVSMFLDDDDMEHIFSFIQDHAAQRSQFAFTFLERSGHYAHFPEQGIMADLILKLLRMNFQFGVRAEHVVQYLNDRFMATPEVFSANDLREWAPDPIPPAPGRVRVEHLALGELVFSEGETSKKDLPF